MKKTSLKAYIFYFLMVLTLLDLGNQLRKISFNEQLENYTNPLFSIVHTLNTGSAFGFFSNNTKILATIGIFALIFLTFYVIKKITFEDKWELISITLFSAGALGNLIERLSFGHVVDFIKLNFMDFPIFNVFDIMICTGVIIYFYIVLFEPKGKKLDNNNNTK